MPIYRVMSSALAKAVCCFVVIGASRADAAPLLAVTFDPGTFATGSPQFTADELNLKDYARVDITGPAPSGGTSFVETGFLQLNNISYQNEIANPLGNRASFSLYFEFTATGIQSGSSFTVNSQGTYSSLDFVLYGANDATSFGISGSNNPFALNSPGATVTDLAHGSLIAGTSSFSANPVGAGANISATFLKDLAGFVVSPSTATLSLQGAFNNDSNIVNVVDGGAGFTLNGGGGDITFNAVTEPASLALLGVGLLGTALVRRMGRKD